MRIHPMSRAKALHLRDEVEKFKMNPIGAGNINVIYSVEVMATRKRGAGAKRVN